MFTIENFQHLQGLGYQFYGQSGISFVSFVNNHFANFDLAELLNTVENEFTIISPTSLNKGITTSIPPPTL